jgi:hypothetical protein
MIDPGLPIKKNHSRAFPSHIILLDTETKAAPSEDGEMHHFHLGWLCELTKRKGGVEYKESWSYYDKAQDILSAMEQMASGKSSPWIMAHNLFFDLQAMGFFPYFTTAGWKLDFLYDKGLTFCMVIKKHPTSLKLISSTNYFDVSLESLGQDVGLEKMKVDFKNVGDEQLARYCRRDVEILKASLLKYMGFCREHDTGRFAITRASQSMAAFRHRFMKHEICIHSDPRVKDLERLGYFGGRVEAFQIGKCKGGPYVFLDFNSMYPSVMREKSYPTKLLAYSNDPTDSRWQEHLDHGAVLAEVELDTPTPYYAVRHGGKVVFPVGRFTAVLCTGSLQHAIGAGHLLGVKRWALYQAEPIFKAYVDYFYPLKAAYKKSGNPLYTRFVKLFLNSLYGKFGSRAPIMEMDECPDFTGVSREYILDATTGERWIEYAIMGTLVRIFGEEDTPNTFVAIAAHVTEYARLKLAALIQRIGWERVLYCDTDSIVIRKSDLPHLRLTLDSQKLGSLSLDKETRHLCIHGCKDYETDTGRKTKGIPKRAEQLSGNQYRYLQFDRLITHQRGGVEDGVKTRYVTKTLSGRYDKGIVGSNGRVSPFHFPLKGV